MRGPAPDPLDFEMGQFRHPCESQSVHCLTHTQVDHCGARCTYQMPISRKGAEGPRESATISYILPNPLALRHVCDSTPAKLSPPLLHIVSRPCLSGAYTLREGWGQAYFF